MDEPGTGSAPSPETGSGDPLAVAPAAAEATDEATAAPAAEASGAASAEASDAAMSDEVASPTVPRHRRLARVRSWFHIPRTPRGFFALLLVLGAFGFATAFGGATLIKWTETADFCGRCHQMGPELAAYDAGAHREVACAECHVEPGVLGWVKAKLNGTKQLFQVITGLYPKPVPPPDHANLPAVSDTCMRCHTVDRLSTASLVTRLTFTADETNSRQLIGLLIRPGSGDLFDKNRGVHWHVLQDVEYATTQPNSSTIDYVKATQPDGSVREFIAQDKVQVAEDVEPDIAAITSSEKLVTMSCLDCHNRVGHPIPNPRVGIDSSMASGRIDPTLPYIKREGMRLLDSGYPDFDSAAVEVDKLSSFYQLNYPAVAAQKQQEIGAAITEIDRLYKLTATPDMKVTAKTYPDNLGHIDSTGCFRCHDGGHFLVQGGKVTTTAIPSSCDTCHTFPQIGSQVASLPVGVPPPTHSDRLWVFNHKGSVTSLDPGGTSCGQCHARDYCVNCHSTGAVTVTHDQMLTNHASVIATSGNKACAYCHQPAYCARCHTQPVLPANGETGVGSVSAPNVSAPEGITYPIRAGGAVAPP